jgi:hypothetical protein
MFRPDAQTDLLAKPKPRCQMVDVDPVIADEQAFAALGHRAF